MKPGKVLCCMFLLAFWGVDPVTKPDKIQKVVKCAYTANQLKYVIHA